MADLGYRSIEVVIINDTRGDLVIQAAGAIPDSGAWIEGEKSTSGTVLKQYSKLKLGVKTDDDNGLALATFQLTGLGSFPVEISFSSDANGASNCSVTPNDHVQGLTSAISTDEENHTVFLVQLVPALPAYLPRK